MHDESNLWQQRLIFVYGEVKVYVLPGGAPQSMVEMKVSNMRGHDIESEGATQAIGSNPGHSVTLKGPSLVTYFFQIASPGEVSRTSKSKKENKTR